MIVTIKEFSLRNECRFKIPNQVNEHNYIRYGKEESVWNIFDGSDRKCTSF